MADHCDDRTPVTSVGNGPDVDGSARADHEDIVTSGSVRSRVDAPGAPSEVVREAKAALATGQAWKARDLLGEHLESERDNEALKLLGEVLHRLGDLPGAGAAWFATSAKGPLIDEAVAAWRADLDDDFVAMWSSIPAAARREPLTPKLAALRAKALEADPTLDDPHPSDSAASARAAADADKNPGEQEITDERAEGDAGHEASLGSGRSADRRASRRLDSSAERNVVEAGDPGSGTGTDSGRTPGRGTLPALADPPARTASSDSVGPAWKRGNGHADSDGQAAGGDGFDAAKVIAWILAALFVVCAVVGLITILQWIVPGN